VGCNEAKSLSNSRRTAIVIAAEKVSPAVVSISVLKKEYVRAAPMFRDPFFDYFFSGPLYERTVKSLGSGFIVSEDGFILTNQHVVEGAEVVKVTLSSGEEYDARVIGTSKEIDLAVLKIEGKNLPISPLGNSGSLLIGEWAVAIGNPFGFLLENPEPTVSCGVISAVNRNIHSQIEGRIYKGMIQTDAAINPGNSGGPLVNANGDVIGINTFIFSESGGSIGIGFAIPINTAKKTMREILRGGGQKPWIGLQVESLNPIMALALGSPITTGAIVASVDKGSPAGTAGFEPGDIIYKIGKRKVDSKKDFDSIVSNLKPGDRMVLYIIRNGEKYKAKITVGKR
jgi:serine protease Do